MTTKSEAATELVEAARNLFGTEFLGRFELEAVQALREAIAAYDAAESEGWQSIETAPKDGTEIIGWNTRLGRHIVSWKCQPQHNPYYAWISSTCNINHIDPPTRWSPLLPPPAAGGEE